jgi:hypothetical protein
VARFVILAVFIEASTVGRLRLCRSRLHLRFGLSFTAIGLIVGTVGIGGLIYAASAGLLVNWLGQPGLAIFGGVVLGLAYLVLAIGAACGSRRSRSRGSGSASMRSTIRCRPTRRR